MCPQLIFLSLFICNFKQSKTNWREGRIKIRSKVEACSGLTSLTIFWTPDNFTSDLWIHTIRRWASWGPLSLTTSGTTYVPIKFLTFGNSFIIQKSLRVTWFVTIILCLWSERECFNFVLGRLWRKIFLIVKLKRWSQGCWHELW